jgi:hypothetical protein
MAIVAVRKGERGKVSMYSFKSRKNAKSFMDTVIDRGYNAIIGTEKKRRK